MFWCNKAKTSKNPVELTRTPAGYAYALGWDIAVLVLEASGITIHRMEPPHSGPTHPYSSPNDGSKPEISSSAGTAAL